MSPRSGIAALCLVVMAAMPGCGRSGDVETYLRSSQIAIAAGKYDAASLALNNVLQARPDDMRARIELARVALVAGNAGLAERQARAATRIAPDNAEARELLCTALRQLGEFHAVIGEFAGETSAPILVCRGDAYLHMGSGDEAAQLFADAIDRAPDLTRAHIGLAQSTLALGEVTAARSRLIDIVDDNPFSIPAHNALGALYAQQGQYAEAQLIFLDAVGLPYDLDNAADWLQARVGLAEMNWRLGNKQRALAATRDLLTSFASHPLPKYLRALFAYEDGEYPLASEYLRGVLGVLPDHQPSMQLAAAADLAQGRVGSAQIHLTDKQTSEDSDPMLVLLLSKIYMSMGNAEEAADVIKRIDTAYLDAAALAHSANAHAYSGDIAYAIEQMSRAVAIEPNNINLQIRYAAMLLADGQLALCDELMAGWPTDPQTQQARSVLRLLRFLRAGDLERAQSYAKRRRRENPSEMIALLALAEAAEQRGIRDQAVSWLEVARERNSKAVEPRFLLADYAQRGGDADALRVLAEEILAALPYNSNALELLGEAYLNRGDTFAAIETLREAHRVAPSSHRSLLTLIRSQLAAGDFWQARKDVKLAVAEGKITPRHVGALIIEEYRRGNTEQAYALAEDLKLYFDTQAIGAHVLGDLHLLAGEYSQAVEAYLEAQEIEASRIVAIKATTAAVAAGLDNPAAAVDQWLLAQPADRQLQRVGTAARATVIGSL